MVDTWRRSEIATGSNGSGEYGNIQAMPRDCPSIANSDQRDIDRDGIGDVCDDDDDADGLVDEIDNCPTKYNAAQEDVDGNRIGDAVNT